MCGIAGIVSPQINNLFKNLNAMKPGILSRGPDGDDTYMADGCGLVHTRLSIIDVEGGKQPMSSNDNRYTITFNGEIYGYLEHRKNLYYPFKTESDTEVLLALYIKYGPAMLDKITGMFAFAIWDNVEKTLFCARDRFGEKPFYYALNNQNDFIFSSSLKSIIATELIEPEIEPKSIYQYLNKLYVGPKETIYKNISTLLPGHSLLFCPTGLKIERYWNIPLTNESINLSDAREKFVSLLGTAVDGQMVADVPLAAFLSGGLDSSTITSIAAEKCPQLTTLTYRMQGEHDEGEYAKVVAQQYKTNHIEMFDESHYLPDLVLKMADVYDEPFADSSSIPTYLICKEAKKHSKVILTGDGADELLGGYTSRYNPLIHMLGANNSPHMAKLVQYLMLRVGNKIAPTDKKWQQSLGLKYSISNFSIGDALDKSYTFFNDFELEEFGIKRERDDVGFPLEGNMNDALKMDSLNYMPADILVKTDRASMANGVELRSPFLDKDLAEFVMSLPSNMKIDLKKDKILLREAFESKWPKKVQGRGKQGFGPPIERWLKNKDMKAMVESYLSPNMKINSYLPQELVQRYSTDNSHKTWALLNLSVWLEHAN